MKLKHNCKAVNKALNAAKDFQQISSGVIRGFSRKHNAWVHVVTPYTNQNFTELDKFEEDWKIEEGYLVNGPIRSKLSLIEAEDVMEKINKAEEIAVLSADNIKTLKAMSFGYPDGLKGQFTTYITIQNGYAYATDARYLIKASGFPHERINIGRGVLSLLPDKMDCVVKKIGTDTYLLIFDNILYIEMKSDYHLPNFDVVIPSEADNKTAISAKQLIKEIDAVSPAANKKTNMIKSSGGSLIAEDSSLEKHAKIDTCLSFEHDFGINHKLLKGTIKAIGDCEVSHISPNKPLLLKNDLFTAIVMPIILD